MTSSDTPLPYGNGPTRLKATLARGGTSRALLFDRDDLPLDETQWPRLFARALGSPDPYGNQLNGLGAGYTSVSKVAVLSRSSRPDCDVDYFFAQIDPASGAMAVRANCGNISSAVGPFAAARGWVVPQDDTLRVRIFNENSGKRIVATLGTDAHPAPHIEIAGVAGEGPAIQLAFVDPGGSVCAGLFPTGHVRDRVNLQDVGMVDVTLIDATLPTVIVRAEALGIQGDESHANLQSNADLTKSVEELRIAAGMLMGLAESPAGMQGEFYNMPDVVLISKAVIGDVRARFYSGGTPHKAAPVTSSIALACACFVEGTVASVSAIGGQKEGAASVTIDHPRGQMTVCIAGDAGRRLVHSATIYRTARLLMEGDVLLAD